MNTPLFKAAARGDLQTIFNLLTNGYAWIPEVTIEAAKYGHLNVLQFAIDNKLEIHNTTALGAALLGQMDSLKFLFENKCEIHLNVIRYCMSETPIAPHNIECLKICIENGFQLDTTEKDFIFRTLNYCINVVDMDDPFFYHLLLKEDLSKYPKLEHVVNMKREEIKVSTEACYSILPFLEKAWMPPHLIKDCLIPYF
jgi:hypothetical protein